MINIIKRIFCKHDFEIMRIRYGFFVFSHIKRCKICDKERMLNKEDLQEQFIHPKPIKEDDSHACSHYLNRKKKLEELQP